MSDNELLEREKYFKNKRELKYSDMEDCENSRQQLKFAVMVFFLSVYCFKIIKDAQEYSERWGEYEECALQAV